MGEVPTTNNKALGIAEAIINGATMKVLTPLLENYITSVPYLVWLKTPVLYQVFCFFVEKGTQALSVVLQVAGVKLIVTLQTDAEKSAYSKAEGDLRSALFTKDPAKIKEASDAADKAFDSLIHSDGSSPVIN